jgi:AraC-like DNA-binding protein
MLVSMRVLRYTVSKQSHDPVSRNLEAASTATGNGAPESNDAKLSALIPVVQDVRLRNVLHGIGSRPSRKMNDLALECNLSVSRLQHLFKQRTGLGLGELLAEQRIRQAADLLVDTNMSIKEIAGTIGYEHSSSFTRAFERRFQQSPSRYRQARSSYKMPAQMTSPVD